MKQIMVTYFLQETVTGTLHWLSSLLAAISPAH